MCAPHTSATRELLRPKPAEAVGRTARTIRNWERNAALWQAAVDADGDPERTPETRPEVDRKPARRRRHFRLIEGSQERKTSTPSPPIRTPAHGNWKLQVGNPGNRGGPGVPPSALRERLRGSMGERVEVLEEIADDPDSRPADRIRAINPLAKYGLGTTKELSRENVRDRLVATIALIREQLPEEDAEAILVRMREVWR